MAFLEFKEIYKNFGAVKALKDVNLTVEKGEIRALLGGNGSGKSTLSRIAGGTVAQTSGEIFLDGEKLNIKDPITSRNYGFAVTSQELSLFPSMTVVENLSLFNVPRNFGIFEDRATAYKNAVAVLEKVGMTAYADTKVRELADNQKYLIEFAKAILTEPKVLIVDEITSALHREEVQNVAAIMKEMAENGCCILFISHRMNEIFDICSSISVLRNGELINTYDTKEATMPVLLIDMIGYDPFSGREQVAFDETMNDKEVVLEISDLSIPGFHDSHINLALHKGEVIGIAGLQGQGQSDLLRMLYGIYVPTTFTYKGKTITATSPEKQIQQGIGFLSGDRVTEGVFPVRNIGENAEVINNLVLSNTPIERDEVLKRNGVKYNSAFDSILTLSGGNQQKVVISRWSAVEPEVLLCDDPTKGIDVAARFEVHKLVRQMAEAGSSILFVSSDDEELSTMAMSIPSFSVCVMYEGNIVKTLRGSDINVTNIIAASMPFTAKEE